MGRKKGQMALQVPEVHKCAERDFEPYRQPVKKWLAMSHGTGPRKRIVTQGLPSRFGNNCHALTQPGPEDLVSAAAGRRWGDRSLAPNRMSNRCGVDCTCNGE